MSLTVTINLFTYLVEYTYKGNVQIERVGKVEDTDSLVYRR